GLKLEFENSIVFATAAQVTANEWLLTQQMLKAVGIDFQWIDPPDVRTHAIKVLSYQKFSRPYQYGVAPVGSRSDLWIYNTYKCKGQANYGGLCDADLDKLVEKVSSLPRPSAERAAVAKQVEEWFWENVPWVPLTETWRLGWRQPWITNVSTTSDATQFYAGAGADKAWVDCAKAQKYSMPAERRPAACK
ncbi:MAG: hypothetical protein HY680_01070, partial [Chloroflexi bacterium]|nr:hypothetical protein [Chloroflexota bacterium]